VVPIDSILCTAELRRRTSRPPDYNTENRALVTLAQALTDSPLTVLQTLAETLLEICRGGSAGISLLTTEDNGKYFYWLAIAAVSGQSMLFLYYCTIGGGASLSRVKPAQ
jgi:hypothetical protein